MDALYQQVKNKHGITLYTTNRWGLTGWKADLRYMTQWCFSVEM